MDESSDDFTLSSTTNSDPASGQIADELICSNEKTNSNIQPASISDNKENSGRVGMPENLSNHVSVSLTHATSETMDTELSHEKTCADSINATADDIRNTEKSKGKFSRLMIESDSDNDNIDLHEEKSQVVSNNSDDIDNTIDNSSKKTLKKKFRTLLDSDSDDEDLHITSNDKVKVTKSKTIGLDSDSDDDVVVLKEKGSDDDEVVLLPKSKSNKFSTLIDSESDDDADNKPTNYSSSENHHESPRETEKSNKKSKKEKTEKKKTGSKRAAKDEAMRQIHSETQRLAREAAVSLPYHRPKQRTLQEFLNRKKITPIYPQSMTIAAKLRLSAAVVSQALEEKEKEAELFYKSSDSEDETVDPVQLNESEKKTICTSTVVPEFQSIEETQKINKIDIQNAQNKKQIIQQGALELGVPRKLFLDDVKDPFEVETIIDTPVTSDLNTEDVKVPHKEFKEGLKEVAVPRKLFDGNFEDLATTPAPKHDILSQESTNNTDTTLTLEDNEKTIISPDEISEMSSDNNNERFRNYKIKQNDKNLSLKIPDNIEILSQNETSDLNRTKSFESTIASSVDCPIAETPLLSNEEFFKLHHKHLVRPVVTKISDETQFTKLRRSSSLDSDVDETEETPKTTGPTIKNSESVNIPIKFKVQRASGPLAHMTLGRAPSFMDSDWDDEEISDIPKVTPQTVKRNPLSNLPPLKPKLHGAPGMMIDLNQDVKPNKAEVNNFLDRFLSKHAVANKPSDTKTDVTVIHTEETAEGIKISEEKLPYKIPVHENINDPELSKPGAKFARLKEDLKKKMVSKRNEEWKQKGNDFIMDEETEEDDEELAVKKKVKEIIDLGESESETEPEEEDDIPMNDVERKTCTFGDDEAEVSEDEDVELSDDEDEGENEAEDENIEEEEEEEADDEEEEDDEPLDPEEKPKKFSRIVQIDDDDTNSRAPSPLTIETSNDFSSKVAFDRKRTDLDIFDDDDDNFCLSGQFVNRQLKSQDSQNSSTESKQHEPPLESPDIQFSLSSIPEFPPPSLPSQIDTSTQSQILEPHKKLFNVQDQNVTDEDLLSLCSGKFFTPATCSTQRDNKPKLTGLVSCSMEKPITDSQILSMCSGKFSTQSHTSQTNVNEHLDDESSRDLKLTLEADDDDELSIVSSTAKEAKLQPETIVPFLNIATSSSDEDEDKSISTTKKKLLKKRKVKQLIMSDDENGASDEEEEEIVESDEDKFIDYDSEENEVVVVPKKEIKKVAANFLEDEAELSESDWGSEDEDEKDLDKLELEEGDAEDIDEDQMRNQLGKIHARRVLDDDQRDVRMLQEMLFDDGDLHSDGAGRERKFKWKNIDNLEDENVLAPTTDDDDGLQQDPTEIEKELEWRKLRLEREKFLAEKSNATDNELFEGESSSQLFKFGMKVLKKNKTMEVHKTTIVSTSRTILPRSVTEMMTTIDGDKSKILHKAMKRGSFLARGDEALAKLAVMAKKSDTLTLAPKHSKNFLFTHISPSVASKIHDDESEENNDENLEKKDRKRKSVAGTTPRTTKKPKFESKPTRSGKKLF